MGGGEPGGSSPTVNVRTGVNLQMRDQLVFVPLLRHLLLQPGEIHLTATLLQSLLPRLREQSAISRRRPSISMFKSSMAMNANWGMHEIWPQVVANLMGGTCRCSDC